MGKAGRPKWVPNWDEIDKLCAIQATRSEIAAWFNVSEDTIERAVKRDHKEDFAAYFAKKRKAGFISIRRAMFQKAQAGDKAMITLFFKKYLGLVDTTVVKVQDSDGKESPKVREAMERVTALMSELARKDQPTNRDQMLKMLAAQMGLAK